MDLRLNTVKDYVLEWAGDAGTHPHLFLNREEMAAARMHQQPLDKAQLAGIRNYWISGLYKGSDGTAIPAYHDGYALGAYLLTNDLQVAKQAQVLERLRNHLALQGRFDTMRYTCLLAVYYDTLIDDPLTPPAERDTLRALFAYLGYTLADPATWSCERGYRSYNLNMSVSNLLNLGMVAAAIPTHPMAKTWARPALAMTESMLRQVGPAGEWPESISNYTGVTASALLAFAIAARNAGFHDYVDDPRMKRLLLCLAKEYTPCDPRAGGDRVAGFRALPPHGRGWAGERDGLAGAMARATLHSDPAYAKQLQWAWLAAGASWSYPDARLGGLEYLYLDKTLPAETPAWGSELFPQASVIFRSGVGTTAEHQVNLICGDFSHAIFPGESGGLAGIWSFGVPVVASFAGGYAERDELLVSRVCIGREAGTSRGAQGAVRLLRLPLQPGGGLHREAGGNRRSGPGRQGRRGPLPSLLDTSSSGLRHRRRGPALPSRRRMGAGRRPAPIGRRLRGARRRWTGGGRRSSSRTRTPTHPITCCCATPCKAGSLLSGRCGPSPSLLDTPEALRDTAAALARSPRPTILPSRMLAGDRFTALGQFGVDVEYFIAGPTGTPRHTLRWGTTYHSSPDNGFTEYHDLLHLQMPGDGAYFVAFYPRKRETPAPAFARLGEHIIKVSGDFGTDLWLSGLLPPGRRGGGCPFPRGCRLRPGPITGLTLALGAAGEITYRDFALQCDAPAAFTLARSPAGSSTLTVTASPGVPLTLRAPGRWRASKSINLTRHRDGFLHLTLPKKMTTVVFKSE